jgi:DNA replication initiation complex subunit (GINS family)
MSLINRYLISEERKEFTEKIVATIGEMQKRLTDSIFRATESSRLMQESFAKLAGSTVAFPTTNIPQVFN